MFSQLKKEWDKKTKEDIPSIITGDFNNVPESELYQYMIETFGKENGLKFRSAYDVYNSDG